MHTATIPLPAPPIDATVDPASQHIVVSLDNTQDKLLVELSIVGGGDDAKVEVGANAVVAKIAQEVGWKMTEQEEDEKKRGEWRNWWEGVVWPGRGLRKFEGDE